MFDIDDLLAVDGSREKKEEEQEFFREINPGRRAGGFVRSKTFFVA